MGSCLNKASQITDVALPDPAAWRRRALHDLGVTTVRQKQNVYHIGNGNQNQTALRPGDCQWPLARVNVGGDEQGRYNGPEL